MSDDWKRSIWRFYGKFLFLVLGLHWLWRSVRLEAHVEMDQHWPLSIFSFTRLVWQDYVTLVAVGLLWWSYMRLFQMRANLRWLALTAGLLIMTTNLLHGVDEGWRLPVVGEGVADHQYWQDAKKIQGDLGVFIMNFNELQLHLLTHSRTHPPGPIVYEYGLLQIYDSFWIVGVVSLILGLATGGMLYGIIQDELGARWGYVGAAFFWVLPSVMIYGWFSIDVVIMSLVVLPIWLLRTRFWYLAGVGWWLALMMNFSSVLLLPVLGLYDWVRYRSFKRGGISLLVVLSLLTWMRWYWNFDYLESMQLARSLESRAFWDFLASYSYFSTRMENVIELVIFGTPLLWWLLWQDRHWWLRFQEWSIAHVGGLMMLGVFGVFALGSYATGETGRATMFVFPFLLFMVVKMMAKSFSITSSRIEWMLNLVIAQSVLLQVIGFYIW